MVGVKSFSEKNPKSQFPNEMIGNILSCYYGGRTECKIRKKPENIDLLDFLSMYPTVCTLQNLWKFVIADHIDAIDATKEVIDFVEGIGLDDIQDKSIWAKLQAIVLIEPDHDVLPLRAKYGDKFAWNIGLPYVVSTPQPVWYSLADVVASKLYTGKTPKILRAVRFVPVGTQKGLKNINIHGIQINPYKDDLFKKLIEYRQQLKDLEAKHKKEENKAESELYKRKQKVIKIIANAISYGIYVEVTTYDSTKKMPIDVFGLEKFQVRKRKLEESGFMFNPIIAVAITSAARLLLAGAELVLQRESNGKDSHAYCDTDSMIVPSKYTDALQKFFYPLNPYDVEHKEELQVFEKEKENVWFYGISAKRYCLYTIDENGNRIIDNEKTSSHGLGYLLDPFTIVFDENDDEKEKENWHLKIWKDILDLEYGDTTRDNLEDEYENKYALQKLAISKPNVSKRLAKFNESKEYHDQIKPSNFCILGFGRKTNNETGEVIKPIAPYCNPPVEAVYDYFVDYNEKNSDKKLKGKEYWRTFWQVMDKYLDHRESKFESDNRNGVGGLNRKHIEVSKIIHIGKESNNLIIDEELDEDSYQLYENPDELDAEFSKIADKVLELTPKDVKELGIIKTTLWRTKKNIESNQMDKISNKIKSILIQALRKEN